MLVGTLAFSIDAIIPGLPAIAAEFAVSDASDLQFILLGFILGMGGATLIVGPLSDSFGRKPVILFGAVLYISTSIAAAVAPSLDWVIAARVLQGAGAAAPRVVAMALVRDIYAGRGMARILSLMMVVFSLVPAIAPMLGAGILLLGGWRAIFWAFALFSLVVSLWLGLRQPETLLPENRRPLRLASLTDALREVLRRPQVRLAMSVQTLIFAMLFSVLIAMQPIFELSFGRGQSFVFWIAGIAVLSAGTSLLNAQLVERFGMLWLIQRALIAQITMIVLPLTVLAAGPDTWAFPAFIVLISGCFCMIGLTVGNLNALALQPLGHVAGMAASVISALATLGAALLAAIAGLAFTASPLPLALTGVVFIGTALILSRRLQEG